MFQATTVANTILRKASEDDAEVTCLKLQGILYFLASYYAKITNKKLFNEDFETWTHGPVLPSIYRKFGSYGAEPIKGYAKDAAGVAEFVDLQDNKTFRTVLDNVYDATKETTNARPPHPRATRAISPPQSRELKSSKSKRSTYLQHHRRENR